MRAVNLLPKKVVRERRLPATPVLAAGAGTVLLTAFLTVSFLSAGANVAKQREALEAAQSQLSAATVVDAPSPLVAALPQQKEARTTALTTALAERVAFDRILRDLSRLTPSDVWLESLNAKAPVGGEDNPNSAPTGLTVSGYTYSLPSVARFLARLQVVPELTDVLLGKSSLADINGKSVVQFTISANVLPEEAPEVAPEVVSQ
jgi:Tfp pilus assembly protein PilN